MKVGHMVLRNFADEIVALTDDYDKLKAENVALRDSRKRWHDRFLEAIRERNALDADNQDLRAGQGRWPETDDSPSGEQVPRVISADQVRPEQIIAYWQEGVRPNPSGSVAHVRAVELEGEGGYRVTDAEGRFDVLGDEDDDYTIVLLEDAPTSEGDDDADQDDKPIYVGPQPPYSHAILPGGRIFSYDQAKHIKDGDPETKPAPRLTIHALNTAPVGSVVTAGWGADYTKHYDGQWCDNTGRLWSDGEVAGRTMVATLTHPERGDHE